MSWDYTKAFEMYTKDNFGEASTLEEFIDEMNEQFYDDDMHFLGYSDTSDAYGYYVFEIKDKGKSSLCI